VQGAFPALGIDEELDQVVGQAEEVVALLQEMSLQLASYLEHLPDDSSRLAEVDERLALLERIARRHGGSLEAAIERRDQAARMLAERGGVQDSLQRLGAELASLEADLSAQCASLSAARELAARQLEAIVTRDLRQMLMPHATFRIRVWRRADPAGVPGPDGERVECGRDGFDRITFELAPNTGDRLRPLGESASGGELSRVALALLAHLSGRSGVGTVVFDEIDQGLGGEAANRVGELLMQVARERQVICVTHLAPIAARASTHLLVAKVDEGGGARSSISVLSGDQRVAELARLLAGDATPTTARAHARELLAAVGPISEGS
jgi:DNA repair protein RecN (Recombination protein N)